MTRIALVPTFLVALFVVPLYAAPSKQTVHTVDYVIGLLEAGVDQDTIVDQIHDKALTFRIGEGDLARLREAGADEKLVKVVTGASVRPEGPAPGPGTKGPELERPDRGDEAPPGADVEPPGRPEDEEGDLQEEEGYQGGSVGEAPHGGYPYYVPGEDYGYYGMDYYPYWYGAPYYYPYYPYPWSFYYSFYYPSFWGPHRFFFHGTRPGPGPVGPFRPRGSSRGSIGGSSRGSSGGHGSGHASPRGSHH